MSLSISKSDWAAWVAHFEPDSGVLFLKTNDCVKALLGGGILLGARRTLNNCWGSGRSGPALAT